MATAAPPDPGLASVESAAASRLASALSGSDTPESTPSAPATPTPEAPASPPSPPTEAAPATTAPAPTPAAPVAPTPETAPPGSAPAAAPAPTTINPSDLSPEARRFLDANGGDVTRALANAAKILAAPAPASPTAPPVTPPAPVVDEQALQKELTQLLDSDPECLQLVREFNTVNERREAILKDHPQLDQDIAYFERRLKEPDVDEVAKAEFKDRLADLKYLRLESRDIETQLRTITGRYDARANQHGANLARRSQDEQRRAEKDQEASRHAVALEQGWKPALDRAATKHGIPASLAPKLSERARAYALANLEQGLPVEQLDTFFDEQAKAMREDMDVFHREQSAAYARQAEARVNAGAATPATTPAPAAATAQAPNQGEDPLQAAYRLARARLEGRA